MPRIRFPYAPNALAAVLLALALAVALTAACGGDDDANDKPATSVDAAANATPGKTQPGKAAAAGSDEDYVKQLCTSLNTYLDAFIRETSKDSTLLNDEARLLKVAAPILAGLGDDLSKARPPRDVQKYHEQLVGKVKEVAKEAEDGTITSLQQLSDFTSEVEEPPAEAQARLQAVSGQVKECQDSALGGSLFGG